jgi:hypothetical protein
MPPRRRPAPRPPRDIVEFVTGDDFLGDKDYSPAQIAVLKAIYGLPMTSREEAAFLAMHEGKPARKDGYDVASLGFGRGSGKGDKIGAPIIAYECVTFNPGHLSPGETAYAIIIAQNEKQAMIVRDFAEAKLKILEDKYKENGWWDQGVRIFEETPAQSKAVTAEVIRLWNRVYIAAFPCKKVSVRGYRSIAVVFDEYGHWQLEEGAYNADKKILRAVIPTRTKFQILGYRVPLVKISTPPDDEIGQFYEDWKERDSHRQLVLHEVASQFLNPTITDEILAKEQFRDPYSFDTEFLAKWGSGGEHKPFPREIVDACTDRGRQDIPPKPGTEYAARIDAAFKRDTFPLGIGHLDGSRVVVDLLRVWRPAGKGRPLNDKEVVSEIVGLLRPYGIDRVTGDQFCDIPLKNEFATYGIGFVEKPVTEASKYLEYKNLIAVMRARLLSLPDMEEIRADLTGLQKKGKWIGAPRLANRHDDISTVIRGIVFDLLPISQAVDLEALNAGAIPDRDRLFKEHGMPLPDDPDRLPTGIMSAVY